MKSSFSIKTLNNHIVTPPHPPTLWQSLANLCNYKNTLPLLILSLAFSLPVNAQEADPTDLCSRTAVVKTVIVSRVSGKTNCADITTADLAGVTGLSFVGGSLAGSSLRGSNLKSGDFAGLTGLTELNLDSNEITTLPADIFTGLTSLTNLNLSNNPLPASLPASLFADVPRNAITLPTGTTINAAVPMTVGTIANITDLVANGSPQTVDVANKFSDPGDTLTYTATSATPAIASVAISGSTLTITPVALGTTNIMVTARDTAGQPVTQTFVVTVSGDAAAVADPDIISSVTTLIATEAVAITPITITNNGGAVPATGAYSIMPAIANGLSFNTDTGEISGTPANPASAQAYIITATNTTGTDIVTITITVNAVPIIVANPSTLIANVGTAITPTTIMSTGGPVTSYFIALFGDQSLNAATGLDFDPSTGSISGTPTMTTTGALTYGIFATNAPSVAGTSVVITILAAPAPDISPSVTALIATQAVAITPITIDATAGGAVDSYSISPDLPAGLSINPSSGEISGTPTAVAGAQTYTITATNAAGDNSASVTITVNAVPIIAADPHTLIATVGTAITPTSITNTGGPVTSYAISLADSQTLKANTGLDFDPSTGSISGTPTMTADRRFYTISATNAPGFAHTASIDITIVAAPDISPSVPTLTATVGTAIPPITITNNGGAVPATGAYSISPNLPAGLSINPSIGSISGTPTAVAGAQTYTITANGVGIPTVTATATVNITVNAADNTAPDAPVIPQPTTPTNDDSITISGSAEADATVTLSQNGTALATTATAGSNGAWSIEVTLSADNDGANTFTATATDQAGNASGSSNEVTVTLDQTKPTIAIRNTSLTSPTNDNPIPINLLFSEPLTGFEASDITVHGGTITAGSYQVLSAVADGRTVNVTFTITPSADGPVQAGVAANAATDAAGNDNANAGFIVITYDGTAPDVAITSTAQTVNTAAFTLTGTTEAGATVDVLKDGTSIGAATVTAATWTFDVMLTEGANLFTVTASDAAGNVSEVSAAVSITLDNTAAPSDTTRPSVAISSFPVTANIVNGDTVNATTLRYEALFDEPVSGFEIGEIMVTGTAGVTMASGLTGAGRFHQFEVLRGNLDGTVIVSIAENIAEDAAGNGNTASDEYTLTIDTTPPVITRNGDAALTIVSGTTYTDAGATASDNIAGTITDSIITSFTLDDTVVTSLNSSQLGTYIITYNVSDAASNPAPAVTRTVTVVEALSASSVIATAAGDKIRLQFVDQQLTNNDAAPGDFTLSGAGAAETTVTGLAVDAADGTVLILSLSGNIAKDAAVTLAYTRMAGSISGVSTSTSRNGIVTNFTATAVNTSNIVAAPNISISPNAVTATAGTAIADISITSNGGDVASYGINPDIGNGLLFNTSTGTISGTPAAAANAILYTITANNSGGMDTATVTITVEAPDPSLPNPPVCMRHPKVQEVIIQNVHGKSACGDITAADLAGINSLVHTGGFDFVPPKRSDFAGLTTLLNLDISGNNNFGGLTTLPADLFQDLPALRNLSLTNNQLRTLPIGIFEGLSLIGLTLGGNPWVSLPTNIFNEMASVSQTTRMSVMSLASVNAALPAANGTIPAQSLARTADPLTLEVATFFSDPGDTLTYTATSATPAIASVAITGSTLTITPVALGTTNIMVTARDTAGQPVTQTFALTVSGDAAAVAVPIISISATTVTATVGSAIADITIDSTTGGGGAVASYGIAPDIGNGLLFDATTGTISGTPTAVAEAISYTITATNSGGTATATVAITVNAAAVAAPIISISATTVTATVGTAIADITIDSTTGGGGAVASYGIAPDIGNGLLFDATTGTISGTPTAVAEAISYIITATNSGGTATATVAITVNAAAVAVPIISISATTVTATVGSAIADITIDSTTGGGGAVASYGIAPDIGNGLLFDANTGTISGTPTAVAEAISYTITATNSGGTATATVAITVNAAAVAVAVPIISISATTVTATVGSAIADITIDSTTGGGGAVASYGIAPDIGNGLLFDANTGTISGTPTAVAEAISYTITATNSGGTATATVAITVNAAAVAVAVPIISISATTVTATVGSAIADITIDSTTGGGGAVASYGIAPDIGNGLLFDANTGTISGTPTAVAEAISYTITATNSGGTATATVAITVNAAAVAVAVPIISISATTVTATVGTAIADITIDSTTGGGGAVASYSINPDIGNGLLFDATTGTISGTPTAVAEAISYIITATNSGGTATATVAITVNAAAVAVPIISISATTVTATVGSAIADITIDSTTGGGGAVASYGIAPDIGNGLLFDATTGTISGTPTAVAEAISYIITATNSGGTATATVAITVNAAAVAVPIISISAATVTVTVGSAIADITIDSTTGGGGAVASYGIAPDIGNGLLFDANTGTISGTPTATAEAITYTITATNSGGTATATVAITVNAAAVAVPIISISATTVTATVGSAIADITIDSTTGGGGAVASYGIAPDIGNGLLFDANTGTISGTPTAVAEAISYIITATNSGGTATATVAITVNAAAVAVPIISISAATVTVTVGSAIADITIDSTTGGGGAVASYGIAPDIGNGLLFDANTGTISGTPTAVAEAISYIITATNSGGTATATVAITVNAAAVAVPIISISATTVTATVGSAIADITIDSTTGGGGAVASYGIAPDIGNGLLFDANTGTISGTPTAVAEAISYTITATNSGGTATATVAITVNAAAVAVPIISISATTVTATVGSAIADITIDSTTGGGGAVASYSINPDIGNGLLFDATTGTISGTPTAVAEAISYIITATNSGGTATAMVNISVTASARVNALTKISTYAQTDGSPVPTLMDYTAAGVTGVTTDNLDIVNAAVLASTAIEADTTAEIQALVTEVVKIVERIKQLNTAIMPRLTQAMLGTTLTSISSRLDSAFSGAAQSSRGQLDGVSLGAQPIVLASFLQKLPGYVDSLKEGNTNWQRMLANSSFTLSPQEAQSGSAKGLTVWGIGDYYSNLGGKDDSLDWDGEVFTVQLGIDKQLNHNLLVGGLVSWSDGDVDADLVGIERSSYKHRMISVHPYLAWSGKHAQLWGSLGYGQGKLKIGLGNDNPSLDTRLVSIVAGGEGHLSNRLSLKSDIALTQTDIDGSSLSAQQDTNSQRLRLLLKTDLICYGHYTAVLEAGARYDHGDGDSGLGAVLDASMAYNNPGSGLTIGAKLHTLLGRDNYSEWGLSGLLELTTKANGRGLAFSLSPSYSLATQDSQAIWQENQLDSANNLYAADQQMQLDTRLSYGLLAFATQGLLTPYSEVTFGGTNSYRLGIHWQGNNRLDLHLFGEHRASHSQRADQAIMLKGTLHF